MGSGRRGEWVGGAQTYAHTHTQTTLTKGTHGSISLAIVPRWIDIQWLCPFPKNNMQVTGMYVLKIAVQLMTFEPSKHASTHTHTHARFPADELPQDKGIKEDYPELQQKREQLHVKKYSSYLPSWLQICIPLSPRNLK